MKSFVLKATMIGVALASGQAMAHVGYGNALYSAAGVYDALQNTVPGTSAVGAASNFTSTVASNGGYLAGLDPNTLGNTHDIRFRYFTLASSSLVSFTINGLANATISGNANPALNGITPSTLNPAFSLYNGVLPASSHEGVGDIASVAANPATAAYLATANDFASWGPFAPVNGLRGGLAAGVPGNNPGLWGVFDSNGSITTGNNATFSATVSTGTNPPLPAGAPSGSIYLGGLGIPKISTITYTGISGADALTTSTFVDSTTGSQPVLGADGVVDNKVSWSGILAAGTYTLAIGGANIGDYTNLFNDVRNSNAGTLAVIKSTNLPTNTGVPATDTANTAANAANDAYNIANFGAGYATDSVAQALSAVNLGKNNLYAADRLSRNLSITGFSVAAVPVPGAVWLFLTGLMGVLGLNRRKKIA